MGAISFIIGITAIYFGYKTTIKANESMHWHQTNGVITKSSILKYQDMYNSEAAHCALDISFNYVVNGQEYEGTRFGFGEPACTEYQINILQKIIDAYPVNKNVIVNYNPSNPSEAVINPGHNKNTFTMFNLGILFTIISFALFWIARHGNP